MSGDDGFLSRWARRKAQARGGESPPEPLAAAAACASVMAPATSAPMAPSAIAPRAGATEVDHAADPAASSAAAPASHPAPTPRDVPPPPTLDEAQALTPEADFHRFVAPGVGSDVRNTALKKLWADPHFNVMDGLDIYIDDYGKPDPLPAPMLRKLAHSAYLNLFEDDQARMTPPTDPAQPADPAPPADLRTAPDENPALRLQPHDKPGPPGVGEGAGQGPGRER